MEKRQSKEELVFLHRKEKKTMSFSFITVNQHVLFLISVVNLISSIHCSKFKTVLIINNLTQAIIWSCRKGKGSQLDKQLKKIHLEEMLVHRTCSNKCFSKIYMHKHSGYRKRNTDIIKLLFQISILILQFPQIQIPLHIFINTETRIIIKCKHQYLC